MGLGPGQLRPAGAVACGCPRGRHRSQTDLSRRRPQRHFNNTFMMNELERRWYYMDNDVRPDANLGLDGVPHTGESITVDGILTEPQAEDYRSAIEAPKDPAWYKGAVFYEVLV